MQSYAESVEFWQNEQKFWAMGEGGRGFRLEFMGKSKLNKKKTKIIEYSSFFVY